jgi:hypothetical protein
MDRNDHSWPRKVIFPLFSTLGTKLTNRALISMYRSVNKFSRRILEKLELAILEVEE